jgi:hypothetical protein
MTEAEWLACADPEEMLEFLRGRGSDRKLRLFAVGCCKRINDLLTDNGRLAVLAAEQFADNRISRQELHAAWAAVGFPKVPPGRYAASAARASACSPGYDGTPHAAASAVNAVAYGAGGHDTAAFKTAEITEQSWQAVLLRCIFGNPLRPVSLNPAWRTPTVSQLAQAIYADRAFERLPILADALEEAGCTDAEVLGHCRGGGEHARGCWALDLVLGKE